MCYSLLLLSNYLLLFTIIILCMMAEAPNASIQQRDDQATTEELHHASSNTGKPADAIGEERKEDNARSEKAAKEENRRLTKFYRPLHKAALNGDWESAKIFLIQNPDDAMEIITRPLNVRGMNVLHIAANLGHAVFMKKLVESRFFRKEALRSKDNTGWTALHYVASVGSLSAVKLLIDIDNTLTQLSTIHGNVPLFTATNDVAPKKVVWYLTRKTNNDDPSNSGFAPFSGAEGAELICALVDTGYYDICLYLFKKYPDLAAVSVDNWSDEGANYYLLYTLYTRPSDFPSGSKLNFWERWIYHVIPIYIPSGTRLSNTNISDPWESSILPKRIISKMVKVFGSIRDEKYKHQCIMQLLNIACEQMSRWEVTKIDSYFKNYPLHSSAAEKGATEIIRALFEHFPEFMDNWRIETSVLLNAIKNRQENVYNFMMEISGATLKFFSPGFDEDVEENALHDTAKLAPYPRLSSVSCPALQMQRELQWFKAVEKFLRPSLRVKKNKEGKTARDVFTTEHRDLVRDAERWMKDTARSCLVVATLIITVVFTAAFTIPGGNIDGTGTPLLLRRSEFLVFAISDAIGMFSSATSILMFLSILTARYAEDDFLYALPKRLILGLVSLLIALATMMITFGAALYIILHPRFKWIIFPIIGLTSIPVGLFIMLQLPLIVFMIRSTCGTILKDRKIFVK